MARVADRVRRGGHRVPDDIVRRRFFAGLRNLFAAYLDAVDTWQVYDNANATGPRRIAMRTPGEPAMISDPAAWTQLEELRR